MNSGVTSRPDNDLYREQCFQEQADLASTDPWRADTLYVAERGYRERLNDPRLACVNFLDSLVCVRRATP
jgi:hypothetical protein